jgi:hypothetical protein
MPTMPVTRYTAAAKYFEAVRTFAQTQPDWAECILKEVPPGYEWNGLHRIAYEVYADTEEWLTIYAASGLDSPEQPLTPRVLRLPTPAQREALKALHGLRTQAWKRDGTPDNPLSTGA